MVVTHFQTLNQTLREVLANGVKYRVPPFQRDYSWGVDEWGDLWQDIEATYDDDSSNDHYLGYLVLFPTGNKRFDVVDGQQRLTTVSLLVLAAIKRLEHFAECGHEEVNNRRRAEGLRSSYVGALDPVSLATETKLQLNRQNMEYFEQYIVPLRVLKQRGISRSQRLLCEGFWEFERRLEQRFPDDVADGAGVAQFVEDVMDRLFVTVIRVDDEVNAFTVFETLNARGVRLSSTDLLKNYLFSVVAAGESPAHDVVQLETAWGGVVESLQRQAFPEFLRVLWASSEGLVRRRDVYRVLRRRVTSRAEAYQLVRRMADSVDVYCAVLDPSDSRWSAAESRYLGLLERFGARQHVPLTLVCASALRGQGARDFERVLRAVVVLTFRCVVIGGQQGAVLERVFGEVARQVSGSSSGGDVVRMVLQGLKRAYPSDETFKAAFRVKTLVASDGWSRGVIVYVLRALQEGVADVDMSATRADSVEHVLPQNPKSGWDAFDDVQVNDLAHRLGNMVLIPASLNKDVGNTSWEAKRAAFMASGDSRAVEFAESVDEWTPQAVQARQTEMAKQATAVWRIDFPT